LSLVLASAALLLAAASSSAADAGYTLGVPGAPTLRAGGAGGWLSANPNYPAMSIVAPGASGAGLSAQQVAGEERVRLAASEAGFPFERTKPEYYLGDQIEPPNNVDWPATYARYLSEKPHGFLFDPVDNRVFTTAGGTLRFNWVLTDGSVAGMTYVASASCSGRPRRIYWTDYPYNAPAINLSGKFVKFFGPDELLTPVYGVYTNSAAGIEQVLTNRVVSGLWLDPSTKMLYAYGKLQGQVIMAYYDTGLYERLLHVQAVEICRPAVNRMKGEIGRALKPDGRGYDTSGLRARPTYVTPPDNRGDYYYQHRGQYSYSPKHGNVYPLRPTADAPWNMEVYWMETDEMLVEWPFELDQYECDWPKDATVFVRGDKDGDGGRPVYVPNDYASTLMDYQAPEGHARAVETDGTFKTTGEGWSLLKLEASDNIWFVPVHSILRSNASFFTLVPEEIAVGRELVLRGGTVAGLADGFAPICDPASPGYIYRPTSDPVWNPRIYADAKPDGADTDASSSASSGDTNKYDSVVYAVRPGTLEVWWNTSVLEEGMPKAIEIPTLPQVYSARWPDEGETPQIVIASQLGSASASLFSHNAALYLSSANSTAELPARQYFDPDDGGTLMFWMKLEGETENVESSFFAIRTGSATDDVYDYVTMDVARGGVYGNGFRGLQIHRQSAAGMGGTGITSGPEDGSWHNVAVSFWPDGSARIFLDAAEVGYMEAGPGLDMCAYLDGPVSCTVGKTSIGGDHPARPGVNLGEILLWNRALTDAEIALEFLKAHTGREPGLTGCYTFIEGRDLAVTGTDRRTFTEKILSLPLTAVDCLLETAGPPAIGTGVIDADADTTPTVYAQNDKDAIGYNPNEEHALVMAGSGGYVAWALRADLNTASSSEPGVLVEYVKDGRKAMQWFDVAVTNVLYPELAADCVAGKAFPGPHPIDMMDDPWCAEDDWDEPVATAPAFRDRKGQLWARAAGTATMRMYYRMQQGFAFPELPVSKWPAIGDPVPWLSLLGDNPASQSVLTADPAAWTWRVSWPETVPEMEIGRTLTVAASGLPEVWNAGSVGVVWPATDAARDATAVLFDPTVAQTAGFDKATFSTVADAIKELGIKQGAGGNATLRKGRWTFDGLPPNLSKRFYLDTTADVGSCIKLEGEKENNPAGVSLLHVNVLSAEERKILSTLLDDKATNKAKTAWKTAIGNLATAPVRPSKHKVISTSEDIVDYQPRDHYALFSMGATNYVTLIQNDSTNELMSVDAGDPISMHVIKVVPKYYVGRVVTREDPLNLLSQQLSVIYAEAFAGKPDDYIFEWRKCPPHADGSVPTDFDGEYTQKFEPTQGLTRFVIGAQGDTLANMVNTYYAMRYRAASPSSPAYAAMGDSWSAWTDEPALAEGWVQRVLNNVTPFAQRMRDLAENEAETPVSMIVQAGKPYEGDVALSQDNLTEVGLIQLYETLLSKAESMSLSLGIDDAGANKQLQLAVARLADLYTVLGDEAWTDALNPTIGFGGNFNNVEMTGFELDYGALSSTLFAFDNQVPTLLDEELALLRGRSGANAPSTHISPYYNRLVWNFSKGITAGEVAYAVNYDVSGDNTGIIDENDAARIYPQGHGDAYGHYLSALSGYYRLLRNPYFTWGAPAMGEMVVADSVLNVDYYDEAKFAKAAYDVAKVAAEVVDRTARKAYRDNGGASSAGYLDDDSARNFGYGEWASRGGFGALANWAVGNALLTEAPSAGRFYRYAFTGSADDSISASLPSSVSGALSANSHWTLEFQLVPAESDANSSLVNRHPSLFTLSDSSTRLSVVRDADTGALTATICSIEPVTNRVCGHYWFYTNSVDSAEADEKDAAVISRRIGDDLYLCLFVGAGSFPTTFPLGYDVAASFATAPPAFTGWDYVRSFDYIDDETGEFVSFPGLIEYEDEDVAYEAAGEPLVSVAIGVAPEAVNTLVALRAPASSATNSVDAVLFDADGAVLSRTTFELPEGFQIGLPGADAVLGGGYAGEVAEVRIWSDATRTDAQLRDKREYVSPLAEGLAAYLRPIADAPALSLLDEKANSLAWSVSGGTWISAETSGVGIDFEDEGLARIDRSTVPELASLASMIPDIQKKVDRMDLGLTPLGLAPGAIPFDLTPIAPGEDGLSHYEQIRERAGTALANARKSLDKAQFYGSRMRLLYESQVSRENQLETMELETKNRLIEYFGYPYEGDIGPGGTYPQGYDGPDLINYAWMEPKQFGLKADEDVKSITTNIYIRDIAKFRDKLAVLLPNFGKTLDFDTLTYEKSATGIILKPDKVTGKRRACGQIQEKMGDFLVAYRGFKSALSDWERANVYFEYQVGRIRRDAVFYELQRAAKEARFIYEQYCAVEEAILKAAIVKLELASGLGEHAMQLLVGATPHIVGAGMTVNTDPSAIVGASLIEPQMTAEVATKGSIAAAKVALAERTAADIIFDAIDEGFDLVIDQMETFDGYYDTAYDAAGEVYSAARECRSAYVELLSAECAVETVVAEAERVIDERTLARQQATDQLTKTRYNEMFFRLARNNALTRYDAQFELAQRYAYLAAQAYDYETGLLSTDRRSGDAFLARIVGTRTLGEFDDDGDPIVASDAAKGDGGLAAILAEMDENWLVIKPRLGINNPQPYATWFSLRHDLFRIYDGDKGDKQWKTQLRKYIVDDLRELPEFSHYCQPLAGSTADKEPGLVIPFSSVIAQGYNFFGEELEGGDASLDPTYFATHISAAGIHFDGYDDDALSRTPTAYLVPVGEDRIRAVGDPDTVISWKVVDQTIPAPYAIGSTQLDDPDWTPLYDGATGGNDLGARIRKHPSFRAYYGDEPDDDSLDCTRLVGRSAWNTKWLLIIPASSMGADREAALSAFIDGVDSNRDGALDSTGVSDIRIGLKTYSTSGN
jgi:hypothetical protein